MALEKIYEYARIIETVKEDGIIIVISHIREVIKDSNTNKRLKIISRYSKSEEYNLGNVPTEISNLKAIKPKQLSPGEFDELRELYKTNIKGFLFYEPRGMYS